MTDQIDFVEQLKKDGNIIAGDDGFHMLWLTDLKGGLNAWRLRAIADYMEELDKPLQDSITEYFENHKE